MDGTILETGVIFRDVSKRFYKNKSMSRIGEIVGGSCQQRVIAWSHSNIMEKCGSRYMKHCELISGILM
jgi:hypothetical protein